MSAVGGQVLDAKGALQAVIDYHQRSKHSFEAYAAGPETLDWDDQPDPFRTFEGAPAIDLPLRADTLTLTFSELYTPPTLREHRPFVERLAIVLERSLGLAAWKVYGTDRWALRCNPSSGNLHPTESYIVTSGADGLAAGVYHYLSRDHRLEARCRFESADSLLPQGSVLIGLSSIHWREAWKYGERAYRYCQHDCGHAIAALSYAAAALGWSVRLLEDWSDVAVATLLGLDRAADFEGAEREHPDVLLSIQPSGSACPDIDSGALLAAAQAGQWSGMANTLSARHDRDWPAIDVVTRACEKPATDAQAIERPDLPEPLPGDCTEPAMTLIRRRRSAQRFDGQTAIDAAAFYRILDMTLPRTNTTPWAAMPWAPRIHLLLFVHRVNGLNPGLYLLVRDAGSEPLLREGIAREEFNWQPVEGCPAHLNLYSLVQANSQRMAAKLSCQQAIAGDSAFSLGMLAEFDAPLAEAPWRYRQLYWEAGMLGQVLYLEAEAAGVSGTGIGCYFDDPFHALLGITDTRLQSLYHFTVGGAVTDQRIATTPPYGHLGPR